MTVADVGTGEGSLNVLYNPVGALVPDGYVMASDPITLDRQSGQKVVAVCASWGGDGELNLHFTNTGGHLLGFTKLPPGWECNIVYGGPVDQPFVVKAFGQGDVQLYSVTAKIGY